MITVTKSDMGWTGTNILKIPETLAFRNKSSLVSSGREFAEGEDKGNVKASLEKNVK